MLWTDENTCTSPCEWDMDGKGTPYNPETDIITIHYKIIYFENLVSVEDDLENVTYFFSDILIPTDELPKCVLNFLNLKANEDRPPPDDVMQQIFDLNHAGYNAYQIMYELNLHDKTWIKYTLQKLDAICKWENVSGNGLWSDPINWDIGSVPAAGDTATFDGLTATDCLVDALGSYAGNGVLDITRDYIGTITLAVNFDIGTAPANTFTLAGGTFNTSTANYAVTCYGVINGIEIGGTFKANGSTITVAGGGWDSVNFTFEFGTSTIVIAASCDMKTTAPTTANAFQTVYNLTVNPDCRLYIRTETGIAGLLRQLDNSHLDISFANFFLSSALLTPFIRGYGALLLGSRPYCFIYSAVTSRQNVHSVVYPWDLILQPNDSALGLDVTYDWVGHIVVTACFWVFGITSGSGRPWRTTVNTNNHGMEQNGELFGVGTDGIVDTMATLNCGSSTIRLCHLRLRTMSTVNMQSSLFLVGGHIERIDGIFNCGTSTVHLYAPYRQNIGHNSRVFYNVTLSGGDGPGYVQPEHGDFNVDGLFHCTGTRYLYLPGFNPSVTLAGGLKIEDGFSWVKGSATVTFDGGQTITDNNVTKQDLGAVTTSGLVTVTSGSGLKFTTWTIAVNGTWSAMSYNHILAGNFTNDGTFTAGTSTVTITSTALINGISATSFYNLTIDAASLTVSFVRGKVSAVTNILRVQAGRCINPDLTRWYKAFVKGVWQKNGGGIVLVTISTLEIDLNAVYESGDPVEKMTEEISSFEFVGIGIGL